LPHVRQAAPTAGAWGTDAGARKQGNWERGTDTMQTQTHILVVDDDPLHTKMLTFLLAQHGYVTTVLDDPRGILDALRQHPADLILTEVALPYQDGFSLCALLKRAHPDTPVVILSARRDTHDVVKGFEQGADDYVIRPYEPAELLARLQAVLRRYRRLERNRYGVLVKVGGTALDLGRLTFTAASGLSILVTPTEMRLLECLMRNAHAVITREQLIEQTWGYDSESADNRVDVYIRRLRHKIEADPKQRTLIRTIRGVGYVYEGDQARVALGAG
jgi:DNA-binding response OmpR family regulator